MKKSLTMLMVSLFLFVGTALAQTKITGTYDFVSGLRGQDSDSQERYASIPEG